MSVNISKDKLDRLKEINVIIYSNNKIAILKPYSRHSIKNCTKDLLETFIPLLEGLLNIAIFPFKFIYRLYGFLPIVRIIKENEKQEIESIK